MWESARLNLSWRPCGHVPAHSLSWRPRGECARSLALMAPSKRVCSLSWRPRRGCARSLVLVAPSRRVCPPSCSHSWRPRRKCSRKRAGNSRLPSRSETSPECGVVRHELWHLVSVELVCELVSDVCVLVCVLTCISRFLVFQ